MEEKSSQRLSISWSTLMKYAVISSINLAILLVGIAIGVMLAPRIEKTASASSVQQSLETQQPSPPTGTNAVKIIPAQPALSAGTVAAYLLLSHHIQSDELVVNGYDVMKLEQAEFELLSRFVPLADIQKAVADAKLSEVYQVSPSVPAASQPQTAPK